MKVRGFDKESFKKSFLWFLNDELASAFDGTKRGFYTRIVSHDDSKPNNVSLTSDGAKEEEIKFKNHLAFIYLKTFYGKNPSDFKTRAYDEESVRFLSKIESYDNPEQIKSKIEECLKKGSVDYVNSELPQDLFFNELNERMLTDDKTDVGHYIFIDNPYPEECRIYINPSQKYYEDLMSYIIEESAKQELGFGAKTRLERIEPNGTLDNLIIYTNAKDFENLVEILNDYGRKFPEKVADFGSTIENLGYSEQEWFGFSYSPQRWVMSSTKVVVPNTFNDDIDYIYSGYILPGILLNNFAEIAKNMSDNQLIETIMLISKDLSREQALEIGMMLKDKGFAGSFITQFCDLDVVGKKSREITEKYSLLTEDERFKYSPRQIRRFNIFKPRDLVNNESDIRLMNNQELKFTFADGKDIKIRREDFSKILESPVLREAMREYYLSDKLSEEVKQARLDEELGQIEYLWKQVCKNFDFLDDHYPFLSADMAEALKVEKPAEKSKTSKISSKEAQERYRESTKKWEEINKVLGVDTKVMMTKLQEMGEDVSKLKKSSYYDLQKLLIMKYGLDEVISAYNYEINWEKTDLSKIDYANALEEFRKERGKKIFAELIKLKDDALIFDEINKLSKYEKEDFKMYCKSKAQVDVFGKTSEMISKML